MELSCVKPEAYKVVLRQASPIFKTMSTLGNCRVVKRKNNSHKTKPEPARKALKKNELLVQFNVLEEKYEALEKEHSALLQQHQKDLEAMSMLEETVQLLERASPEAETRTIDAQTDDLERMWCNECEYPAEDIYDLGEHMYEVHAEENTDYGISCHYCRNFFPSKSDMMLHSKRAHPEKLQPCRNFAEGKCDYTSTDCWFTERIINLENKNSNMI